MTVGAGDLINVHVEGIHLTIANPICTFTVTGTARGTFNEATQLLTVNETGFTGSLTYTWVSGCINQVSPAGIANLSLVMKVSTPGGTVNLLP